MTERQKETVYYDLQGFVQAAERHRVALSELLDAVDVVIARAGTEPAVRVMLRKTLTEDLVALGNVLDGVAELRQRTNAALAALAREGEAPEA